MAPRARPGGLATACCYDIHVSVPLRHTCQRQGPGPWRLLTTTPTNPQALPLTGWRDLVSTSSKPPPSFDATDGNVCVPMFRSGPHQTSQGNRAFHGHGKIYMSRSITPDSCRCQTASQWEARPRRPNSLEAANVPNTRFRWRRAQRRAELRRRSGGEFGRADSSLPRCGYRQGSLAF